MELSITGQQNWRMKDYQKEVDDINRASAHSKDLKMTLRGWAWHMGDPMSLPILVRRQDVDHTYGIKSQERQEEWGKVVTIKKTRLRKEDRDQIGKHDGKYVIGPGPLKKEKIQIVVR